MRELSQVSSGSFGTLTSTALSETLVLPEGEGVIELLPGPIRTVNRRGAGDAYDSTANDATAGAAADTCARTAEHVSNLGWSRGETRLSASTVVPAFNRGLPDLSPFVVKPVGGFQPRGSPAFSLRSTFPGFQPPTVNPKP